MGHIQIKISQRTKQKWKTRNVSELTTKLHVKFLFVTIKNNKTVSNIYDIRLLSKSNLNYSEEQNNSFPFAKQFVPILILIFFFPILI